MHPHYLQSYSVQKQSHFLYEMDWRNKTAQLNSNIMVLIRTKRNQTTRNQPKLQTLLKENDEIKTEQKNK